MSPSGMAHTARTTAAAPTCRWAILLPLSSLWALAPWLNHPQKLVAIAITIFGIVKFESASHYFAARGRLATCAERLAWYLLWPGLDPAAFFERRCDSRPTIIDWAFAVLKTGFGLGLLLVAAPQMLAIHDLAAGWVAMAGLIFTLHFGTMHLAALWWRTAGRDVVPIMRNPLASTSLSEFWGQRWNRAFRDFAHVFVFRPLVRRHRAWAEWGPFVFSGVVHELAISVPAGAGYGLPFAYFMWQGFGVWLERRLPDGLVTGWRGWCYTALFTIPAAYWLFHPAFVRRLILPLIGD